MIESLILPLIAINALAYGMVIMRPKLYPVKLYRPMLLNIKLSVLPIVVLFAIAVITILLQALNTFLHGNLLIIFLNILLLIFGLIVWLLLLPNAGYLITELNFNHRDHDPVEVPLWYDIVGILTLAMSGIMNMCFNVFFIQFIFSVFLQPYVQNITFLFGWLSWLAMGALMVLSSFGIYLGRYIRVNSWDIKHPFQFINKLKEHFKEGDTRRNCWLFVFFHSAFFIIFYWATVGVILQEMLANLGA